LHGFVVVEVQFVHLRAAGTEQASLPAIGALGPLTTHHRPVTVVLLQLQPSSDTTVGSAGQGALTRVGMGTQGAVNHCGDTSGRRKLVHSAV